MGVNSPYGSCMKECDIVKHINIFTAFQVIACPPSISTYSRYVIVVQVPPPIRIFVSPYVNVLGEIN